MSIYLRICSFCDFFTTINHLPEDSVRYVGSTPTTEGIARRQVLINELIVVSGTLRIGTVPAWARKRFY